MGVSFSCQYTNFPRKWSHSAIILFCARVAEWQTRWSQKPLSKRRVSSNLTSGTIQKAKTPSNGSLSFLHISHGEIRTVKWKRVKKTVQWTVFSVSPGALQRGGVERSPQADAGISPRAPFKKRRLPTMGIFLFTAKQRDMLIR